MSIAKEHFRQFFHIVDFAYRRNRVRSMMGTHQKRLRLIIRYTANAHRTGHFLYILVEFRAKRRIFDIVDGAVKAAFPVDYHSSALRAQMGMVINAKK